MRLFVAWLLAFWGISIAEANQNANFDFYTAGVVEYNRASITGISPENYIANNLRAYLSFIEQAKQQNVDILVFPEATFNYLGSREKMIHYGLLLPDPNDKIAPWQHDGYAEVLKELSRKCKDEKIYVLVNVVEKVPCNEPHSSCRRLRKTHNDGFNLFNTNVVFDRQGRVISTYRKYNLFVEPLMDEPLTPQYATFTTDFGVKFGHFICFDIMFKEPAMTLVRSANITNILFASMWFSEIPFYTSTQNHQAWAYANNINVISAGANHPIVGSSGSGIFVGRKEIPQIFISPEPKSKLLVAKVPKDVRMYAAKESLEKTATVERYTPVQMQNLHLSEHWADLDALKIDIVNQTQNICIYEEICCIFNIKLKEQEVPKGKSSYKYKLVGNYTSRFFGSERKCGEFYCAILACTSDNPKSCARRFKDNRDLVNAVEFESIEITAKVRYNSEDDLSALPSTLDTSILPLKLSDYDFSNTRTFDENGLHFKEYQIESKGKLTDILTFGIAGRNFALDEERVSIKSKQLG